jgi:predicted Fe-Mo cluster-binding NifX family protein
MHRIALASTDGKIINQHFGHAENFHIVDLSESSFSFVESRPTAPACQESSHHDSGFAAILTLLSDCDAVLVSRIGEGAAQYMSRGGLRVFEAPGIIEEVLNELRQRFFFSDKENRSTEMKGSEPQ